MDKTVSQERKGLSCWDSWDRGFQEQSQIISAILHKVITKPGDQMVWEGGAQWPDRTNQKPTISIATSPK